MKRFIWLMLLPASCAAPADDARVTPVALDRAAFVEVSPMLQQRCGTLDCHGRDPRNLRMWGYGGLRLDPRDRPDGAPTTDAELDATLRSIAGLEPEQMVSPIDPARLTFYRKGLGLEAHKGGARIHAGDDADRCLRAWLTGARDDEACRRARE